MAPNIVAKEEVAPMEVPSNPTKSGKKENVVQETAVEEEPWYQKYKIQLIIAAVVVVIVIIVASVVASNNNNDDDDEDRAIPGEGSTPTAAPSTFFDSLDKDGDGLVTWGCEEEPFFDKLGRLVFQGCESS